jgi:predicted MPP superfamily phosphohydrolase
MRMLVFAVVFTLLSFGVLRLLLPKVLSWRSWLLLGVGAATVYLGWYASRIGLLAGTPALAVRLVATAWAVGAVVLVAVGIPFLLVRWIVRRLRPVLAPTPAPAEVDLGRRRLLGNAAVPLLAATTGMGGTMSSLRPFEVREEEVRIPDLPPALDGFRIGQITDVHVGLFIDAGHLAEAVEAMNAAGVDLQVMTGDLLDDLEQLDDVFAALGRCRARHGMIAVLGNHEIWRGEATIRAAYARTSAAGGPRLLVDESTVIEHGGARIRVVGVDYPMVRGGHWRLPPYVRDGLMRASAERAFAGAGEGEIRLCLTHHPDFFPFAAERGTHLTLAGHTHGGQVALFGRPLFRSAHDYMLGRYRRGAAHLYVSGGTGHWFPFRLGVPAEVTVLTLRPGPGGGAAGAGRTSVSG